MKSLITEYALYLDKFDEARHFEIQAPIKRSALQRYFMPFLAFSALQIKRNPGLENLYHSLEIFQEYNCLLALCLQSKDSNILVTVCILACLELISVIPEIEDVTAVKKIISGAFWILLIRSYGFPAM